MDSYHWSRSQAAASGGTGAAIGAESGGALGAITGAVTPRPKALRNTSSLGGKPPSFATVSVP